MPARKGDIQGIFRQLNSKTAKDQIAVQVRQRSAFTKKIDAALEKRVGRSSANIVKQSVGNLVRGIKYHTSRGVGKAGTARQSRSGSAGASVTMAVGYDGKVVGRVEYSTNFPQLSYGTMKAKQGLKGDGKFWRMHGRGNDPRGRLSMAEVADNMKVPKVTSSVRTESVSARRAAKSDPGRIDFTVSLELGDMGFPFDELVRRPFVTGDANGDLEKVSGSGKELVFYALEFGTSGRKPVPARPWLRGLSANAGEATLSALINQ